MCAHGDGQSLHNPKSLLAVVGSYGSLFPFDLDRHDSHLSEIQNNLQGVFWFLVENTESLSSILKGDCM